MQDFSALLTQALQENNFLSLPLSSRAASSAGPSDFTSAKQKTLGPALEAARDDKGHITSEQQNKIVTYLELLQKWNQVFNLTTIIEPREMVYLHIIDSLLVQPYLQGKRFLDVGTGAGLPGIPLAIMNPEQEWVLLDKNSKKTRFLTQAVAELMLRNVTVAHARSEDFHPSNGFDTILSRALGSIRMFAETTTHLLNPHGMLIAMKGQYPEEEVRDLPIGFQVQDIVPLKMVGMDVERHIVRIERNHCGKDHCNR